MKPLTFNGRNVKEISYNTAKYLYELLNVTIIVGDLPSHTYCSSSFTKTIDNRTFDECVKLYSNYNFEKYPTKFYIYS